MEKFTKMNNTNVVTPETKSDIIKMIIAESIKVENGVIVGVDKLTENIDKLIQISESKATIKAYESVKHNTMKSLDMNWIGESIDNERAKISGVTKINEKASVDNDPSLLAVKKGIITESVDPSILKMEDENVVEVIKRGDFTKAFVLNSNVDDLSSIFESILKSEE